ncbi:chromate transporter [Caloramator sp. mosi_1]|uniref:chromate transporter n=1 Tax=Caloramator sp. mosi_1 TaxID=3023090 RepID=UPI0023614C8F|nr:chromate transporter [Caloramator sp. mosi_1]WDC84251.1 chromate transporter [Caloramator sp. mosi_1]
MKIISLFFIFFKIGSFSIGGGYAMLSFIQREIVEVNKYIKINEFSDILAISEMTPGPIAINSATFVGYKVAGILGSFSATLGIVLPSFLLIVLITKFL